MGQSVDKLIVSVFEKESMFSTSTGDILKTNTFQVFHKGVVVETFPNLLYSYHIKTELTKPISDYLREIVSENKEMTDAFLREFKKPHQEWCGELKNPEWISFHRFILQQDASSRDTKTLYITEKDSHSEQQNTKRTIDMVKILGDTMKVVPDSWDWVSWYKEGSGFGKSSYEEYFIHDLFDYRHIIDPQELTQREKRIFDQRYHILRCAGIRLPKGIEICVAEITSKTKKAIVGGVYVGNKIIINRRRGLRSMTQFAGTLIHEAIHISTGYLDASIPFENALSDCIGLLYKGQKKRKIYIHF